MVFFLKLAFCQTDMTIALRINPMDLIVLNALKRCEETLSETVRIDLTMAGWETVNFDEDGKPVVDHTPRKEGEGPVWKDAPGTHPLVELLRQAIKQCES